MKKSLVLAMAMALGVTASAYAANPFSDVPTGHWAYDSISKLAAAGVIEGYGDSTFGGDKLMTRYEMAQIVAKAMAKGANVDKLAAEFADELDNLGVRVANLEKKADNVKISGQIRYEYADRDGAFGDNIAKHRLRTRLWINGQINDDWSYTARIQNDQNIENNSGDETTKLNQAYVNGKLGGLKVVAGKADMYLGNGNIYDDTAEFIGVTYGKAVKLNAYWGQPVDNGYDEFWGASLSGKFGNLTLGAGYDQFKDAEWVKHGEDSDAYWTAVGNNEYHAANAKDGADNGIWNVNAAYKMGDVTLSAIYLHSDLDASDFYDKTYKNADTDGYVIGLAYKGANKSKPGTWGLWANYYDQGVGTTIAHTMKPGDWDKYYNEGFKGYGVGGTVTMAKNIVYMLDYYDLEGKESEKSDRILWNRLQITF